MTTSSSAMRSSSVSLDLLVDDFGPPLVAVVLLDLLQLVDDHALEHLLAGEDLLEPGDQLQHLLVLGDDLLPLEAGQALQAHVEDGLRLLGAELRSASSAPPWPRRFFRRADQRDDLVQEVERPLEPFEDVGPRLRLAQFENRSGAGRPPCGVR